MTQCVVFQGNTLVATADAPAACQGYVLQTGAEYTATMTLATALQPPTKTEMGQAFSLGFTMPVLCYVVARLVRSVMVWEK